MDIENFISRAHLSLTSENANGNPDLHRAEIRTRATISNALYAGALMRWIFISVARPAKVPPVIEDTVRYLGAVAAEYEECDDVTEWAYEYGFDPGHLDTREAFNALGRLNRDLWRLVGDPMYEELRQGIAIEQAVDMAWGSYDKPQLTCPYDLGSYFQSIS